METPKPKTEPETGVPKSSPLFALAAALFALGGLVGLFARQWVVAPLFLSLGFLYAALAWRAARKQD